MLVLCQTCLRSLIYSYFFRNLCLELINCAAVIIISSMIGLVWCMDHMGDGFSSEDEDVEENYDSVSHEDDTRTPIELLNVTESFQSVTGELLHRLKTIKG